MKGLLLFSQLNDVLFMSLDDDTSTFINEQARRVSLIGDEDVHSSVNIDVVVQLFSPLIVSQRFMMSEVDNPYNSIRCQNDMIYVFSQIGDHTAIAIGSVTEEKEEYFQRKLRVFKHLLMLFHGPVLKQLHTVMPSNDEKWDLVGQLLNQWEHMYHKEQSFLVEALERVSINEDLNAQCVKLLESVIGLIKSAGDKRVVHALMFVHTKLLALYSSRSAFELHSGDILLMILIASNLYPWQRQEETTTTTSPEASKPITVQKKRNRNRSRTSTKQDSSAHQDSAEEEKTKTTSARTTDLSWTSDSDDATHSASSLLNVDESNYQEWTFLDDFHSEALWDVNSLRLHQARLSSTNSHQSYHGNGNGSCDMDEDLFDPGHCNVGQHQEGHGVTDPGDLKRAVKDRCGTFSHKSFPVFLRTKHCQHTPAVLHLVSIFPGVILVLVSELPKGGQAQMLVDAIESVAKATSCHCQPPQLVVASVDKIFKKLDLLQKQTKNLTQLRRLYQMLNTKWSVVKDLAQKINKEQNQTSLKNRIEDTLDGIMSCLENMFIVIFLQTNTGLEQVEKALHQTVDVIRNKSQDVLVDYKDYLITKALHNVTISSYLDSFPGLMHFIYTDRSTDYMKAPSLNVLPSIGHTRKQINHTIQQKIWDIVQWSQTKLSLGYTALLLHDRQLHFAYFLWYEDAMGNPQVVEQHFRPENNGVLPGILSDNFYRKLTNDCFPSAANKMSVHCYELLCVHIGLVPTQHVLSHCRKLAAMLWELSDVPTAFSIL